MQQTPNASAPTGSRPGPHGQTGVSYLVFLESIDIMNRTTVSILALSVAALSAGQVLAEPVGKTRAEVQLELVQAQRTGDIATDSESFGGGRKLNEVLPGNYPAKFQAAGKTREQVQAELAEAIRTGDIGPNSPDNRGRKMNEIVPGNYPAKAKVAGKTREQVRAELIEAQRNGDIATDSESAGGGKKLSEVFPGQFPRKS